MFEFLLDSEELFALSTNEIGHQLHIEEIVGGHSWNELVGRSRRRRAASLNR
jgi:hypothetical protein